MITRNSVIKILKYISIVSFLLPIFCWIPNFILQRATILPVVTFFTSPVGFIASLFYTFYSKDHIGIIFAILNFIAFFSFFIIMFTIMAIYQFLGYSNF